MSVVQLSFMISPSIPTLLVPSHYFRAIMQGIYFPEFTAKVVTLQSHKVKEILATSQIGVLAIIGLVTSEERQLTENYYIVH
jgi:hypothetical protein